MLEAWVVTGLGFGDCGKGTVTDFLVRDRGARLVVRHGGGAQAGHNVVTPEGRHHTFSQFGSGSFVVGVGTHLGPAFALHPGAMLVEADLLARVGVDDVLERTTIDARALVISPFQQAAGRLRELSRGAGCHGTCGVGLGEAVADRMTSARDSLCAADLARESKLRERLTLQQVRKRSELTAVAGALSDPRADDERCLLESPDAVERTLELWRPLTDSLRVVDQDAGRQRIASAGTVICEGAQGMLLDESWGFHPHTTWSDCSARPALDLLRGLDARVTRLGVTRAYATRHGAGPFPTADPEHRRRHAEPHNDDAGWQGEVRSGPLDLPLLRYALERAGVDGLAVTHLDHVADPTPICVAHEPPVPLTSRSPPDALQERERLGQALHAVRPVLRDIPRDAVAATLERELLVPVLVESRGPTATDKLWRGSPEDFLNRPATARL